MHVATHLCSHNWIMMLHHTYVITHVNSYLCCSMANIGTQWWLQIRVKNDPDRFAHVSFEKRTALYSLRRCVLVCGCVCVYVCLCVCACMCVCGCGCVSSNTLWSRFRKHSHTHSLGHTHTHLTVCVPFVVFGDNTLRIPLDFRTAWSA